MMDLRSRRGEDAGAGGISISAITSRLKRNDRSLTSLTVTDNPLVLNNRDPRTLEPWPRGDPLLHCQRSSDLSILGNAISANVHLRSLTLHRLHRWATLVSPRDRQLFFNGLKKNSSIIYLYLTQCDLSGGMGVDIMLNEFVTNKEDIKLISLCQCVLANEGARILSSALERCTQLHQLYLNGCNIDDDALGVIVSGIRGSRYLTRFNPLLLDLSNNNIGIAGYEVLTALIQDPGCHVSNIQLGWNHRIDDACLQAFADALRANRQLKALGLPEIMDITGSGLRAFEIALCDTTSVNSTYFSNHTLRNFSCIGWRGERYDILRHSLELNREVNKKKVGIQKILCYHPHLDMGVFINEWDLKMLPFLVSWFDRSITFVRNKLQEERRTSARKLDAIYQFARALPILFAPTPEKGTGKRKLDQVN